jgi:hypothetical protein|tara:strand:+ start:1715 stop:3838 length:2124 start_codon:yes stop_codon:yes gene_type:complete
MSFGYNPEMEQQPESEGQSFFFGMMPPEAGSGTEGGMNEDCCDAAKSGLIDHVQNIQNTLARRAMDRIQQEHDEFREIISSVPFEMDFGEIIEEGEERLNEVVRSIRQGQQEANRGLAMAINTIDCSDFKEMLHGVSQQDTIDADNIPAEFLPGIIAIHEQLYQEWLDCEGTESDFGDTSRWGDIFTASQDISPIDAAWSLLKRWGGRTWSADDDFSDYVEPWGDILESQEAPPLTEVEQLEEDMMREGKQRRGGGGSGKKREFIDPHTWNRQQNMRRPSGQRSKSPGGDSLRELEGHKPTADAQKKFERERRYGLAADKLGRERNQRIAREQMGQPVFRYGSRDKRRHLQEPDFTADEPLGRHPGSILDIDDMMGVEQGTHELPRFFRRYTPDGKLNQPISEVMGRAYPKDWHEGQSFYEPGRWQNHIDAARMRGSRANWYDQHGEGLARDLSRSADIHPTEEGYDSIAEAILSGRLNYRDLSQLMPGLSDVDLGELFRDIDPDDFEIWEHLKELNREGMIPRDDPAWHRLQELNEKLEPVERAMRESSRYSRFHPIDNVHALRESEIPEDWNPLQEEISRGRMHGGEVTHHLDYQNKTDAAPDEIKALAEALGMPLPEVWQYMQGVHAEMPFDEDSPEYQRIKDEYENAVDVQRRGMATRLPYPSVDGEEEMMEQVRPTFAGLPFREGTGFTMGEPMDIAFDLLR